jgi:hypothetical protein
MNHRFQIDEDAGDYFSDELQATYKFRVKSLLLHMNDARSLGTLGKPVTGLGSRPPDRSGLNLVDGYVDCAFALTMHAR